MNQIGDQPCFEEESSPVHIKRELEINIPFRTSFSVEFQPLDTPKTTIRATDAVDEPAIETPKTQIDMQSPRLGFLTHSQIVGIANEEEDLVYSRSNLHNPLQSVEEISEEQTPVCTPLQSDPRVPSQDLILDNLSIANSQQLKFSKKSSDKDSMISRLELENSKMREEFRERASMQESKIRELEQENFKLRKRYNEEKVRQLEQQMETEYRISNLTDQFQEKEESLKKACQQLKNDLQYARNQISLMQKQNSFQQQQQLEQATKDPISGKLLVLLQLFDPKFDLGNRDPAELFQILHNKLRVLIQENEEEKMDEHRELLSTLKAEVQAIKQLRGQLAKMYGEYDQGPLNAKKNTDEQRVNELNLQILALKQEKLELVDQNQKLQNSILQKDTLITDLQQKLNNLSQSDTLRKSSSFIRSLQGNSLMDLKIIKETLKQRQEGLKKTFKSQNSPTQSRSHNPSPTLKFLHSPKNSQGAHASNNVNLFENKSQFYRTTDFSAENQTSHLTNSSSVQNEMFQKIVEQFRGTGPLAQKLHTYAKRS